MPNIFVFISWMYSYTEGYTVSRSKSTMNAIAVRTHQGEYYAGETVYGMIYLKVVTPDFREKIHLQISGVEQCKYTPTDGDDWSIEHKTDCLRNPFCDKVMSNPVQILAPADPLPVGSYKFPFHYRLKPDLPRTTSISSLEDNWQASVVYRVTASCSPCDELRATQSFVCLGKKKDDLVRVGYSQESVVKTCFCYDRGGLTLLAELDKSVYTSGEKMKLKVNVQNRSSELVKSVKCWLKRTVKMYGIWVNRKSTEIEQTSMINDTVRGSSKVRLQDEVSIDAEDIKCENLGSVAPKSNEMWECDMYLRGDDGSLLPSTTRGTYIKIMYFISVQVSVQRASGLMVTIPLAYVLPGQNTMWLEWKPGIWMQNCQMLPRHDKLAVRNSILESPVYEGLL